VRLTYSSFHPHCPGICSSSLFNPTKSNRKIAHHVGEQGSR
jgi:hypothetical protein